MLAFYIDKFMASKREERQYEIHYKVIRLLKRHPSISSHDIVHGVGISNGAAYYCVTALIKKGFVKVKNFSKLKTKADYLYGVTPLEMRGKAIFAVQFLKLKSCDYIQLKDEIERLENELGLKDYNVLNETRGSV